MSDHGWGIEPSDCKGSVYAMAACQHGMDEKSSSHGPNRGGHRFGGGFFLQMVTPPPTVKAIEKTLSSADGRALTLTGPQQPVRLAVDLVDARSSARHNMLYERKHGRAPCLSQEVWGDDDNNDDGLPVKRSEMVEVQHAHEGRIDQLLILSALQGHALHVQIFLKAGAHQEAQSSYGYTALICAAYQGHAEVVRILIEANAKMEVVNKHTMTPLMVAVAGGHERVVDFLIEKRRLSVVVIHGSIRLCFAP